MPTPGYPAEMINLCRILGFSDLAFQLRRNSRLGPDIGIPWKPWWNAMVVSKRTRPTNPTADHVKEMYGRKNNLESHKNIEHHLGAAVVTHSFLQLTPFAWHAILYSGHGHSRLQTPDSTYTPHSTLESLHPYTTVESLHSRSTLYTLHLKLYTLHSTLHSTHTTQSTLYTPLSTIYTLENSSAQAEWKIKCAVCKRVLVRSCGIVRVKQEIYEHVSSLFG